MPATQEIKLERIRNTKWETKKLSEVCTILDGKRKPINSTERQSRIAGKPKNSLYPYYGATGQVGFIDDYLIEGEYVLLGEDGAPFLESFKDKAYLVNGKIWVNNHAHILKAHGSNKYLCYFLNQINYREFVSGTTRLKLNQSMMKEIPILLPPLPEQHRIVQKIEELFSELDYAITTLKTTQQQLQTYRQSVLKHAFEGYFTGGNKKWKLDRIGNVLAFINNGYTPSPAKMSDKGDVQFLKVYNLNFDGTLNYMKNPVFISKDVHENELKRSRTYPNDVLINIVGPPLGKVSLVPPVAAEFNINQAIVLFRPNEKITPKFLRYFLQSPQVIHWLEGTSKATAGQYNIKVSTCREIMIPIIDPTLQEKIVFEIETRLSESDYLLQTINQQLIHAESLRQSILQRAFSGEL